MARDERDSRYYYDDYPPYEDRERRPHRRRRHRDYDDDDEYVRAKRERRERRRAEEARREALDIDELRARRASYYTRPPAERPRTAQPMAQEIRAEREKAAPRSARKEVRRDGTVRHKKKRERVVADDQSDEFVYGRPRSRAVVEEVIVRRPSVRQRSDEGGSSRRTAVSPQSGSRSASLRDDPKLSRSASAREPPRVYATRPSLRRSSTIKPPPANAAPVRTHSTSIRDPQHGAARRSTGGLFATLFKPPRQSTTITHKEVPRVECLVCMMDDLPANKTVKLGCGHRMCHSCLKRQFTLSVNDPQHMPPTCCSAEHIPLKHVDRLFDDKFKRLWNKKLVQLAKDKGWQRCYSCKAIVELKEGCNHMTCRCTAQFCMVCAAPWKTCNCPWFNYAHLDDGDRLNDMRVPYQPAPPRDFIEVVEIPSAPPVRRSMSTRIRPRSDRDLNRADEVLAAHLQAQLNLDPPHSTSESRRSTAVPVQVYGLGNSGAHHMNESYTVRPLATSAPRTTSLRMPQAPRLFSRRIIREPVRPPPQPRPATNVTASTMAGLSRDGTRRGANRVGTWLHHVEVDPEAVHTAPKYVEVDDWRVDGTVIGID
ncbi:hypothetical protein P154DRAFT_209379 [Amniculicola lignicola CBS 123094]|uniref:Uncharacterized protein n=1 Tax=Amniculicola lignicola CBS 123094 TaxID=1392246 RepID=A0A6A5WM25_9PLEO|nr:hypothetical protein P154DRAFT_209379 [Amniculicola lignicola CBS 123094]